VGNYFNSGLLRMSEDDYEAKATDYLAKTVLQSRENIAPIGFVHFNMNKIKPKPVVAPPKKKGGKKC
jgi:hypothetical protein